MSVNRGMLDVLTSVKLTGEPGERKSSYPVTPTSSLAGAHAREIEVLVTVTATGVPGGLGGDVSSAALAADENTTAAMVTAARVAVKKMELSVLLFIATPRGDVAEAGYGSIHR